MEKSDIKLHELTCVTPALHAHIVKAKAKR